MILDLPGKDGKEITEYFCCRISEEGWHKIRFFYDSVGGVSRVILKGHVSEVLALVNGYEQDSAGT